MIAIIDYKMGNLRSVENALHRLGADFVVTADASVIRRADRVLLPGVGHCGEAMRHLRAAGLDAVIPSLRQPVLGICVGLQVMCRDSQEGDTQCLGIFDSHVRRFQPAPDLKVPHMGWNALHLCRPQDPLFRYISEGECVYYVHSFYARNCRESTLATSEYGIAVTGAVKNGLVYGTQFHPEKSGETGLRLLKAFA